MGKIERFEDIKAWQLAQELVKKIYRLSQSGNFSKNYSFKDQIQRATVSTMSNIAEGFERYTRKEFVQFLNFARGSVAEVRSQLYIALDLGYVSQEDFRDAKEHCESISRHIWNFMKYLKEPSKVGE